MAFKIVNGAGVKIDTAGIEVTAGTATAFAVGDLVTMQAANAGVIRATSSHDNNSATSLFGVCAEVKAQTGTTARVVPLVDGMVLEADTANNSTADDNGDRMTITDHDTLNNSGTDDTSDTGMFLQIAPVGAEGDAKVLVMVRGINGQVVA